MPELEYKKHMGEDWPCTKPLAFPEYTEFRELFSEWKWHRFHEGLSKKYPTVRGVSDYCSCHSTELEHSLHVKARPGVVMWINANMLLPENDTWYFELVTRGDGTLLVVKNNAIIASRWLALLDTEQLLSEIRHHEI